MESPEFRQMYVEYLAQGQEYADDYVKGLVQQQVPNPTEAVDYCNYIIDFLEKGEVETSG